MCTHNIYGIWHPSSFIRNNLLELHINNSKHIFDHIIVHIISYYICIILSTVYHTVSNVSYNAIQWCIGELCALRGSRRFRKLENRHVRYFRWNWNTSYRFKKNWIIHNHAEFQLYFWIFHTTNQQFVLWNLRSMPCSPGLRSLGDPKREGGIRSHWPPEAAVAWIILNPEIVRTCSSLSSPKFEDDVAQKEKPELVQHATTALVSSCPGRSPGPFCPHRCLPQGPRPLPATSAGPHHRLQDGYMRHTKGRKRKKRCTTALLQHHQLPCDLSLGRAFVCRHVDRIDAFHLHTCRRISQLPRALGIVETMLGKELHQTILAGHRLSPIMFIQICRVAHGCTMWPCRLMLVMAPFVTAPGCQASRRNSFNVPCRMAAFRRMGAMYQPSALSSGLNCAGFWMALSLFIVDWREGHEWHSLLHRMRQPTAPRDMIHGQNPITQLRSQPGTRTIGCAVWTPGEKFQLEMFQCGNKPMIGDVFFFPNCHPKKWRDKW